MIEKSSVWNSDVLTVREREIRCAHGSLMWLQASSIKRIPYIAERNSPLGELLTALLRPVRRRRTGFLGCPAGHDDPGLSRYRSRVDKNSHRHNDHGYRTVRKEIDFGLPLFFTPLFLEGKTAAGSVEESSRHVRQPSPDL